MQIQDTFTVNLPVEEAWEVLLDVERIAPCMPGAELQETDGEEYRGVVKVKLGAITAQFKGAARFTEVDESEHRAVLRAEGREVRGQGNASATVTATLSEADGDGTEVAIDTDLSITGRVAQFGRGVVADVSTKLLGQFATCLEENLTGSASAAEPEPEPEPEPQPEPSAAAEPSPPEAADRVQPDEARTDRAAVGQGTVMQGGPAEPVDLWALAGPRVTRAALPGALVAVLVLLAISQQRVRRWVLSAVGAGLVAALAAPRER
ncbi:MAG: SRPBCC family protein [Actinomycetota bacterium]|nr:SRPBCC family protein [Actinomycetota bacterium]